MADENGNFCVVEFEDSKDIASVPTTWITEELCYLVCAWPPGSRKRVRKLAKQCAAVETTWPKYPCQILHKFDTYVAAEKKERFLESYTDLNESRDLQHGLRKRHRKNYSSSSEDEQKVLPTPHLPVIIQTAGSSSAIAMPDVSSSVSPSGQQDEEKEPRNAEIPQDLDFSQRLERLEKCCFMIQKDVRHILELVQCQTNSHMASLESLGIVENYLPLTSLSSVYELESHLADSIERRDEMRLYLQQLGGSSVDEMVKRMLRHLFTDDLARHFSWVGQKGKNKLCDLFLIKIIFQAVETSRIEGTREKIENRIREWFRQAGTRNKHVTERKLSRSSV